MFRHNASSKSRLALPVVTRALVFAAILATTASLAADIRISDLRDIDFGAVRPTAGRLVNTMDFCVSMSENGRYGIVARGTGKADAFTLSSGSWDLPYTLHYTDKPGRRGALLKPGVPVTGFKAKKRKKNVDCNRPSASIEVTINSADLRAAGAGQYKGVLILTVTPE